MTTHGMAGTPIYLTWASMIQRCKNPNDPGYRRYGERGISVCERWHDFRNFFKDMGEKPKGLSLERKDNDGNYEPGNCCWATQKEQMSNVHYNNKPIFDFSNKKRFFLALNLGTGEGEISNDYKEFAKQKGLNFRTIIECLYKSENDKVQTYKGWEFGFM